MTDTLLIIQCAFVVLVIVVQCALVSLVIWLRKSVYSLGSRVERNFDYIETSSRRMDANRIRVETLEARIAYMHDRLLELESRPNDAG